MLTVELDQEYNQFLHWLHTAQPGEKYLYHVGLLPVDRQRVYYETTPNGGRRPITVWREPDHTVGLMALGAAERGDAHLTQAKLAEGRYAYFATRSYTPLQFVSRAETKRVLVAVARMAMAQS